MDWVYQWFIWVWFYILLEWLQRCIIWHFMNIRLQSFGLHLDFILSVCITKHKRLFLILFGLFGAVSLFFRLEMIFVIIACGLSLLMIYPKDFLKIGIYSFLGFILPFALLLYLNFYIHGHPLGLRYALTLTDNASPTLLGRIDIIRDMLFQIRVASFINRLLFSSYHWHCFSQRRFKERAVSLYYSLDWICLYTIDFAKSWRSSCS